MLILEALALYNSSKGVYTVNRIRIIREIKGLTQADLARELAVSRVAISRYETGQRDLDTLTILRLCEIFGCTADYLLGRSAVPSAELSPEEEDLLTAWRRATPEIRSIIDAALAPYREEDTAAAPTA